MCSSPPFRRPARAWSRTEATSSRCLMKFPAVRDIRFQRLLPLQHAVAAILRHRRDSAKHLASATARVEARGPRATRRGAAAGPAAVADSRLRLNVLRRVAAASRVTPCPARGFGTLASVRRRRRRPFEIKGLLLMLHHLWCAATLAKGVCPTSELRRAVNTVSLNVVATRSAWPATGAAAGARPPEENDSKRLRSAVNQRSSKGAPEIQVTQETSSCPQRTAGPGSIP